MKENENSQITNAFTAAATLASLQTDRQRSAASHSRALTSAVGRAAVDRASQEMLATMLSKDATVVARYDDALRQHQASIQTVADHALAEGVKISVANQAHVEALLANQGKALAVFAAGDDAPRTLLDVPFSIIPTPGLTNVSTTEQHARSSAKFKLNSSRSSGNEEMAFHFIWGNTTNAAVVIDIHGYFVLNGHIQVGSGGGVFPSDRFCRLNTRARMAITLFGNNPPSSPIEQADQNRLALHLETDTGGWSSVGAIEFQDLFRGFDLSHTLLLVPPHTNVVVQVMAAFDFTQDEGSVAVDFASGGFEVVCPGVLIIVRS